MGDKASRTVFIGNIPYDQSEEQIKEICGTVGQVLSFRPIYDPDTGRPRGYGFVEYADADAAASAVRNLHGYKIDGRELRVDFSKRSDQDSGGNKDSGSGAAKNAAPADAWKGAAPGGAEGIGPLPAGIELPPGVTCADAISKTLSTLPPPQLLDILSQMKNLATGDPNKATELLRQAPQLSYAIFQALLLMGLVDSQLIASVVQQATSEGGAPAGGLQPPPPQPGYGHTPPVAQPPYQPPPQQQQPAAAQFQPGQEELLKQVLSMPQSEVDKLGPNERAQIMALRQQWGGRF